MRDVNNGWLLRYFHANTASAFFFLVYLHIGRGIYYGSYQKPRTITWVIGTIILIAMMGTGFLGYVLSLKCCGILKNLRLYSTLNQGLMELKNLGPYFVTGFCDAESSFMVSIRDYPKSKIGWRIELTFAIVLHKKDRKVLELIQQFFGGVGDINKQGEDTIQFRVRTIKDLDIIVNHFDKYPLITQKWYDYQLFKQVFELVKYKNHLTQEGLNQIVSIRASINRGLTAELKKAFPDIIPVVRPIVVNQEIKDTDWLAGFVSGEGNFFILITQSKAFKTGSQVLLRFTVSQHSRDTQLVESFTKFLGCGRVRPNSDNSAVHFVITKFSDIDENIIPFFDKYKIVGEKSKDFNDFCLAAKLIKNKEDLTETGLNQIIEIKSGMNKGRSDYSLENSPPKPHSYQSLAQQSNLLYNIKNILTLTFHLQCIKDKYIRKGLILYFIYLIINYLFAYYLDNFLLVLAYLDLPDLSCFSLYINMSPKLYTILKNHKIKAKAVFENLHLAKTRNTARDYLKGLAGIYIVINLVDGVSMYVGSASTNRLYTRLMMHLYYLKGNSRIAASVKALGKKNFAFVVVEVIPEKITDKTNITLLSLEQYYIDLLKPVYNILPLAGNSFGYKHTPETLKKIRENYSDIQRNKIGSLNVKSRVKNYSNLYQPLNLHPYFVTGFSDGEASFIIRIRKNLESKAGWRVELKFQIGLHNKDLVLLKKIQESLSGAGSIKKQNADITQFIIQSITELEIVINHFDKYPLITQKWSDYQLFKQAFLLVKNKDHLNLEGIKKLVAVKASINLGLSDELKTVFYDVIPAPIPLVQDQEIKDPNWLAGFINAEGCFFVKISDSKTGSAVGLRFQVTQHSRDEILLKTFISYLGCGKYSLRPNNKVGDFLVASFSDINEKIIPFFAKHPISGAKALDYFDFCKIAELIRDKVHLTTSGLEQIKIIREKMNKNRIYN